MLLIFIGTVFIKLFYFQAMSTDQGLYGFFSGTNCPTSWKEPD
jgi:hypothetical protein